VSKPTLRFIVATLRHKWFVYLAGRRLGVPLWRLIVHDWTKFFLAGAYGAYLYGDDPGRQEHEAFQTAWLYHQNHEGHHWEYWIPRTRHTRGESGELVPQPTPDVLVREMVADWIGATRAYAGKWPSKAEKWWWFEEHYHRMNLHPATRALVKWYVDRWMEDELWQGLK